MLAKGAEWAKGAKAATCFELALSVESLRQPPMRGNYVAKHVFGDIISCAMRPRRIALRRLRLRASAAA